MIGSTIITASARRQSMRRRSVHEPMMRKTEEIIEAIACDTNVFTASESEVRFVRSLAGVTFSIVAYSWILIFAAILFRKSRATRSAEIVCTTACRKVKMKIPSAIKKNSRMTELMTSFPFVYASIACEVISGTIRFKPFARIVTSVRTTIHPQYGTSSAVKLALVFLELFFLELVFLGMRAGI
jgi:hypothetical protein